MQEEGFSSFILICANCIQQRAIQKQMRTEARFLPLEYRRNQKDLFLKYCFEEVRYFIILAKENDASVSQIDHVRAIISSDGIYIKEQDPVHLFDTAFMHFRSIIWRILENFRVTLEQFIADLFITVSFGFWWVFSFLIEKSNWRRFNRASVQRCLNFLRVLLEIFHFNFLIQPVFQRWDDKNSFFSEVLELSA